MPKVNGKKELEDMICREVRDTYWYTEADSGFANAVIQLMVMLTEIWLAVFTVNTQ